MKNRNTNQYDDIINLPHHTSTKRPHMDSIERAAQFAPFAALTGFKSAIMETERIVDPLLELSPDEKENINQKLQIIQSHLDEKPLITITYFQPDTQKDGGAYVSVSEQIKKIDLYQNTLETLQGHVIPIETIYSLEGELLRLNIT